MLDYDRARVLYILWGANPGILEKAKEDAIRNTGTHSVAVIYVAHIVVNGHTCTTCIQRSHWHWRTEALEAGTPPWHRRPRNSHPTCKSRNKAGTGTDGSPDPSLLRLNGGSEASAVACAVRLPVGCFPCVYSRDRRSAALLQLRVGDMEFQRELTGWHQLHIVCGEVCDHDSNAIHQGDDTVLSKVKRPAILYTLNNDYKADFRGPTGEMSVGAVPVPVAG